MDWRKIFSELNQNKYLVLNNGTKVKCARKEDELNLFSLQFIIDEDSIIEVHFPDLCFDVTIYNKNKPIINKIINLVVCHK